MSNSEYLKQIAVQKDKNHHQARHYCYDMMKNYDGQKAIDEYYSTEMFTFLFKQALSNLEISGKPYARFPDEIP